MSENTWTKTHWIGYEFGHAPVAQLDRVAGFEPVGREFESLRVRHFPLNPPFPSQFGRYIPVLTRLLYIGVSTFLLAAPAQGALTPECKKAYVAFLSEYKKESTLERELRALCKQLTPGELKDKIAACESPLKVTRSFVAHFHRMLDRIPGHAERMAAIAQHKGRAGNDVHLEQFKITLGADGKAMTVMSDVDDWEHGPLYRDILRLMATARLQDKEAKLRTMFDAYLEGLNGTIRQPPKKVRKWMKEAEALGFKAKEDAWDPSTRKLVMAEDMSPIDAAKRRKIEAAVKKAYGSEAKVLDAAFRLREGGGSGGLDRYMVLVQPPPGGRRKGEDVWVLEFKEMKGSDAIAEGQRRMPELRRIEDGIRMSLFENAHPAYRAQRFDGKPFLFRPKLEGDDTFDLAKLNYDERQELLQWEAYRTGMLHRQTADDPQAFNRAMQAFDRDTIAEEAKLVEKLIRELSESQLGISAAP